MTIFYVNLAPYCPRSLMDRMLACEAGDPGSIPGGDTENNEVIFWTRRKPRDGFRQESKTFDSFL